MRAVGVLSLAAVLAAPAVSAQIGFAEASTPESLAPTMPQGFGLEDVTGGPPFNQPVAVAFSPDGRMFVAEKDGRVWVVRDGVRQPAPLLDINLEVQSDIERGLLGIAVDPDFAQNRRIYVVYGVDRDSTGDSIRTDVFARLTRYEVVDGDPDTVDPDSRTVLLGETFETGIPACHISHSPAMLAFGRDGTLLVGTGDGATFGEMDAGGLYPNCFGPGRLDPSEDIGAFRAQRVESLAGKILRIDPETGYGIPSNPFYTGDSTANASRVWAMGVRNSFRFALGPDGLTEPDSARPGTIYAGDVGWQFWEEVNVIRGGENLGWPCWEGPAPEPRYQAGLPATNGCAGLPAPTLPAAYWHHFTSSQSVPPGLRSRAIIGGAFAAGRRYPAEYLGRLFVGDYIFGWMGTAAFNESGQLVDFAPFSLNMGAVVQTAYDPTTEALYFVNIGTGRIERLRHASESGNQPPVAAIEADTTSGAPPLTVRFSAAASTDPDRDSLTVSWAFGDGWTATGVEVEHTYMVNGTYDVVVTVRDSFHTATASLAVTVDGRPPSVNILEPVPHTAALPGSVVSLRALASDPDGTAVQVKWHVHQVHNDHQHDDIFEADGPTASFQLPEHGGPGDNVFYRVVAIATDASGQGGFDSREIRVEEPREVDIIAEANLIARVEDPVGEGSPSMEVIRDGVWPPPGSLDPLLQFATVDGQGGADLDWFGVDTGREELFRRVEFQEGLELDDGGWFESVWVEVLQDGQWVIPEFTHALPVYRGADQSSFDRYTFVFKETRGDAIRVIGEPGGSERFVSVAELRAFSRRMDSFPPGWSSFSVGDAVSGAATHAGNRFSVEASGGMTPAHDAYQYVYRSLEADGTLTARLASLRGAGSVAGLVIGASLADSAAQASILVGDGRARFRHRATAGAVASEAGVHVPGETPVWLRLQRTGATVAAYVSPDGERWTPAGATSFVDGVRVFAGLAVAGDGGRRGAAVFDAVTFETLSDGAPPAPWSTATIGAPPPGGAATFAEGVFTVAGAGHVGAQADAFHMLQQPVPGRGSLVARRETVLGDSAQAGIMVRGGLGPNAPFAFLYATDGGVRLRTRATPRAIAVDLTGPRTPASVWLRLAWDGGQVNASFSNDGDAWAPLPPVSVALGSSVQAGLIAAGRGKGRGEGAMAAFSHVLLDAGAGLTTIGAASGAAGGSFAVAVRPNPAGRRATADVTVDRRGRVTIEVLDILGRRVMTHDIDADAPAVYSMALDVAALPAGTYVVRAVDAAGREATRVFVVRGSP